MNTETHCGCVLALEISVVLRIRNTEHAVQLKHTDSSYSSMPAEGASTLMLRRCNAPVWNELKCCIRQDTEVGGLNSEFSFGGHCVKATKWENA